MLEAVHDQASRRARGDELPELKDDPYEEVGNNAARGCDHVHAHDVGKPCLSHRLGSGDSYERRLSRASGSAQRFESGSPVNA